MKQKEEKSEYVYKKAPMLLLEKFVKSKFFSGFILFSVLVNSIALGLMTSPAVIDATGDLFFIIDKVCLYIFVLEAILKLIVFRLGYFSRGWNWFDFIIVFCSIIADFEVLSSFRALRIVRVFRALKFISNIKKLQIIVSAIGHSLPSIAWTSLLMTLIYYIFSVVGTMLFAEAFPDWFGSIPRTMYTLFQIMTLDGWSMDMCRPIMETYPYAWIYFVPFVTISAFIVLNIVVGIVVNSISEVSSQMSSSKQGDPTKEEIINEIQEVRKHLSKLEKSLKNL
jgi:voltage-gated sodium channel